MNKFIFLFVYILFVFNITYGQYSPNILFNQNSSGFGLGAQLTSTNGATLVGLLPSYTINGKLSMGLGIGYQTDDDFDGGATSILPSLSYLVMKQGENGNPISLNIGGGYQYITFSESDGTVGNLALGSSVHYEIKASDIVKVIPGGGVSWNKTNVYYNGSNFGGTSGITYGINVAVLIKKLFITPSLSFYKGTSTFNLVFGVIFPK